MSTIASALLRRAAAPLRASRTSCANPAAHPTQLATQRFSTSTSSLNNPPPKAKLEPIPLSLYVKSTRNNTIMSLMTRNAENGQVGSLFNVSGGLAGFKKVQRSGYEAGYQCAVRMFAKITELAEQTAPQGKQPAVTLLFNGFGQGREATTRALLSPDGERVRNYFVRVTDRTPIPIGGVRPKKKRTL